MRCALLALGLLAGCGALPEVEYRREGFELAVEFDHRVCEGTLVAMEERVSRVVEETGRRQDVPMTIYWLTGDLERICPRPTSGCFIPGTQIVASRGRSIHHEIVHAVMNTRGSNPFAEEGLAEVLSGGSAYQRTRGDPLRSFGLRRKDAREGEVDYDRAAHFMHFVRSEADPDTVEALAASIDRDDGPEQIVGLLEQHMGRSASEIVADYERAPDFYPSGRAEETEALSRFDLVAGLEIRLDCGQASTFGPLSETHGGMYQLLRIESETPLQGTLHLSADPGVRATLFREVDPGGEWYQDWWSPVPRLDEGRIELRGGERSRVDLDPAEHWLLLVQASDAETASDVRLWLQPSEG